MGRSHDPHDDPARPRGRTLAGPPRTIGRMRAVPKSLKANCRWPRNCAPLVVAAREDPVAMRRSYYEARRRERDVILPDGTTHQGRTPAHWRRVALLVAKKTGKAIGLDTATRMQARR